jgi:type III secretory pathway component EscR
MTETEYMEAQFGALTENMERAITGTGDLIKQMSRNNLSMYKTYLKRYNEAMENSYTYLTKLQKEMMENMSHKDT